VVEGVVEWHAGQLSWAEAVATIASGPTDARSAFAHIKPVEGLGCAARWC
jgi:hypothetical protein